MSTIGISCSMLFFFFSFFSLPNKPTSLFCFMYSMKEIIKRLISFSLSLSKYRLSLARYSFFQVVIVIVMRSLIVFECAECWE